jgi:large subunit ribosomal protein L31
MKPAIHPNYVESTVTCSCGNTFQTRSTRPQLRTDLCSVCHPFYTGEQRIVDTAGQVERFTRRMEAAAANAGQKSKRQRRLEARRQPDETTVEDAEGAVDGETVEAGAEE